MTCACFFCLFFAFTTSVFGADEYAPDLFGSIRSGDLAGIRNALRSGSNVNARGAHDATPLMWAAQYCSYDCLKLLLDNGADLTARTPSVRQH